MVWHLVKHRDNFTLLIQMMISSIRVTALYH